MRSECVPRAPPLTSAGRVHQIAAFSGSIRAASTNTGLLRAAAKLAATTDGVASFTIVSVDLPLFNEGA